MFGYYLPTPQPPSHLIEIVLTYIWKFKLGEAAALPALPLISPLTCYAKFEDMYVFSFLKLCPIFVGPALSIKKYTYCLDAPSLFW